MKKYLLTFLIPVFLGVVNVANAQDVIDTVVTGCSTELNAFCSQVTPGQGRGLACLYSHSDKLSGQCEYALYDAAGQLERVINGIAYLMHECGNDVQTHCAAVQAGDGRLAQCLLDNKSELQSRCSAAIDATGLTVN
jgi:hypothetical protein